MVRHAPFFFLHWYPLAFSLAECVRLGEYGFRFEHCARADLFGQEKSSVTQDCLTIRKNKQNQAVPQAARQA